MAKREAPKGPSKELEQAIRARMVAAVVDLWSQCGIYARTVRIEITFADGRQIAQARVLRVGDEK